MEEPESRADAAPGAAPDVERRAPYDPMPHGPAEVGLGPWVGTWPTGPQYDEQLLAEGDRRNVVDRYRYCCLLYTSPSPRDS